MASKPNKQVHAITSAQEGLTIDQRSRQRKYFTSMMIRTACFVAAVFLPNPFRWIAMAGAVALPYIAVVVANAGRETILGKNAIMREPRKGISGEKKD
jgi:hypothetical protein